MLTDIDDSFTGELEVISCWYHINLIPEKLTIVPLNWKNIIISLSYVLPNILMDDFIIIVS